MINVQGEKLRQWDIGRNVELIPKSGRTLQKVRFWKSIADEPIVGAISEAGGVAVSEIPNVLLMNVGILVVEMVVIDGFGNYETERANLTVHRREKPADYVFTDNAANKGGGVSSWNDLTDKPFGYKNDYVVPETKLAFEINTSGIASTQMTVAKNPINGEVYTVVYNGKLYSCKNNNGYIGNLSMVGGGENTGEPFIGMFIDGHLGLMSLENESTATISIYGRVFTTLPEELSPYS